MWIVHSIDWILAVSGLATCTMLTMAVAPHWAMRLVFADAADGPVAKPDRAKLGRVIFASGLLLFYAARHAESRLPILLFSIAGKLGFAGLVVAEPQFRRRQALPMAFIDLVMVGLFAWYLAATS